MPTSTIKDAGLSINIRLRQTRYFCLCQWSNTPQSIIHVPRDVDTRCAYCLCQGSWEMTEVSR